MSPESGAPPGPVTLGVSNPGVLPAIGGAIPTGGDSFPPTIGGGGGTSLSPTLGFPGSSPTLGFIGGTPGSSPTLGFFGGTPTVPATIGWTVPPRIADSPLGSVAFVGLLRTYQ